MDFKVHNPRLGTRGKTALMGNILIDEWLYIPFTLFTSEKTDSGYWMKLGKSMKDRDGKYQDTIFCKKCEVQTKMQNETIAVFQRMKMNPNAQVDDTIPNKAQFTADDIPF